MSDMLLLVLGLVALVIALIYGSKAARIAREGSEQFRETRNALKQREQRTHGLTADAEAVGRRIAEKANVAASRRERLKQLESEVRELSRTDQSRLYLSPGPYDAAMPIWVVQVSGKTNDPRAVESTPFVKLPQRLLVNAEAETKAAALVGKRFPDMRLKVRVLGQWGGEDVAVRPGPAEPEASPAPPA